MSVNVGDYVQWNWGDDPAEGTVRQVHIRKITRNLKGTDVTREGSDAIPALSIEQPNGDGVLTLSSEVRRA